MCTKGNQFFDSRPLSLITYGFINATKTKCAFKKKNSQECVYIITLSCFMYRMNWNILGST